MLKDSIEAYKYGFEIHRKLHFLRVNTIVCDQKEERFFVALKSVGSFMDYTFCTMTSRRFDAADCPDVDEVPAELRNTTHESVYTVQTSGNRAVPRNVQNTVSHQLITAHSTLVSIYASRCISNRFSRKSVRLSKFYLHSTSASLYPPGLAAFHDLGSASFHFYSAVGFDKLHAVDLGAEHMLLD